MPFVRISLMEGKLEEYKQTISNSIHDAMVKTINCPPLDRFQVMTDHRKTDLIYDPSYLGINRTDDMIMIQITLNEGRTVELKKALYHEIAEQLKARLEIRPEDIFINLIEVKKENWSFGNGLASYA
ncbi:tautomerase family protein [Pelosinus propionicus]|uniref:Phenylpyruvate tautomerase PptA, 4-oxalocrotonate tautomerase family n=1 Tax=Pelosinus propionicus DSM 13327 TaxID=1123291 RepID=A0A1I4PMD6_9FIRM|nr:tautomerase family protein [Pelosinus propionicus]SFM28888.1 Phenylpyruvate tautomerase PptA, 4-oxalocrotonate tautomerase family [Pelosinus propionicus DSM 13327]